MPFDPHGSDEEEGGSGESSSRRFKDFDCPACDANNPYDDGFGDGDEVRCFYCGQEFAAHVSGSGVLKLREI